MAYARTIHQLITYLDVCDGNMSQGSMRCDANVSIRRPGDTALGVRTEIKNVNSFRFLEQAIRHEIQRQINIVEAGGRVLQETRLYDPDRDETRSMRSKETATDYRYFPEPDLLPVELDDAYIEAIRASMPELPAQKLERYETELGLSPADARLLSSDLSLATYFEACLAVCGDATATTNWVRGDLMAALNRDSIDIDEVPVSPADLGQLIVRISEGTISGKIAKTVFAALWQGEGSSIDQIIEERGLVQVSDSSALQPIIEKIVSDNPKQAEQYRSGKTKLMGFFVGQVMKETGGKANPQQVNELLKEILSRSSL